MIADVRVSLWIWIRAVKKCSDLRAHRGGLTWSSASPRPVLGLRCREWTERSRRVGGLSREQGSRGRTVPMRLVWADPAGLGPELERRGFALFAEGAVEGSTQHHKQIHDLSTRWDRTGGGGSGESGAAVGRGGRTLRVWLASRELPWCGLRPLWWGRGGSGGGYRPALLGPQAGGAGRSNPSLILSGISPCTCFPFREWEVGMQDRAGGGQACTMWALLQKCPPGPSPSAGLAAARARRPCGLPSTFCT